MVAIPPAIILVNDDLSPSVHDTLVRQLFINQILDGYAFDTIIADDPLYPNKIKQLNQRVMVVRTFANRADVPTWSIPDVTIFIKQGLASVEINKGPPMFTVPVLKLDWGYLINMKFPLPHRCHGGCQSDCHCCERCRHPRCHCQNQQFLPGHHFDGTQHQYTHHVLFKPKQDK